MKRSVTVLVLVALLTGMPGSVGFTSHALAGQPSTANSRKLHYVQSYPGARLIIAGSVSSGAPLACNSKIRQWLVASDAADVGAAAEFVLTVSATCRIQAGHRSGQDATLKAALIIKEEGVKTVLSEWSATATSDSDGRFEISWDLPVNQIV